MRVGTLRTLNGHLQSRFAYSVIKNDLSFYRKKLSFDKNCIAITFLNNVLFISNFFYELSNGMYQSNMVMIQIIKILKIMILIKNDF